MSGITAAIGMFDGVHLGHQALVSDVCRHAQGNGTQAAVFTFDRHPMQLISPDRAPQLLTSLDARRQLLKVAGAQQTHILRFDEELRSLNARQFMQLLQSRWDLQALVLGFNHRFGSDRLSDFQAYKQIGQELGLDVYLSDELKLDGLNHPISSSQIRHALKEGRLETANAMLGRYFSLSGSVGHGHEIGRKIGFPTANLKIEDERLLIPAAGVYAAWAEVDGEQWPSMLNIGYRPTVDGPEAPRTIEAHLIGYQGDAYDTSMTLTMVERMRDEHKFDSIEDLQRQLRLDRENALRCLNLKNKKTRS